MGKLEYLDALKRAMGGLPPEIQAKTLAWYEQRFVDGVAAGRSDDAVARVAQRIHHADRLRPLVSGQGA